jgi:hypothetical protein
MMIHHKIVFPHKLSCPSVVGQEVGHVSISAFKKTEHTKIQGIFQEKRF